MQPQNTGFFVKSVDLSLTAKNFVSLKTLMIIIYHFLFQNDEHKKNPEKCSTLYSLFVYNILSNFVSRPYSP